MTRALLILTLLPCCINTDIVYARGPKRPRRNLKIKRNSCGINCKAKPLLVHPDEECKCEADREDKCKKGTTCKWPEEHECVATDGPEVSLGRMAQNMTKVELNALVRRRLRSREGFIDSPISIKFKICLCSGDVKGKCVRESWGLQYLFCRSFC